MKRRDLVAGMAIVPLVPWAAGTFGSAMAQDGEAEVDGDSIETSAGPLTIHPVDHASLVLAFGDAVIYVDPVGGAARYEGLPAPTAVLITHGHGDHFDVPTLEAIAADAPILTSQEVFDKLPPALQGNAAAIANGEETTFAGLPLKAIPAHNITADRMQYHPVGVGNGYLLTFGDKVVYVAGDTEPTPEMLALTGIAVAFLPMNLPYTMTVEQAAEAVNAFKPAIVYPYHYGDSDLDAFEAGVTAEGVEVRRRDWYAKSA